MAGWKSWASRLVSWLGLLWAAAGRAGASRSREESEQAIAAPRARDLVCGVIQGIPNESGRRQACGQHIAERTSKSTNAAIEAARLRRDRRRSRSGARRRA